MAPITFYDIPSTQSPPFSANPNPWKIRYALNFKGLEYSTTWVEMCDIKALYTQLGLQAQFTDTAGDAYYTLPVIHDPSTNTTLADSLKIAEYLEFTYPAPEYPALFPLGRDSLPLARAFSAAFEARLGSLWQFAVPALHAKLNARSQSHIRAYREGLFGCTLEDLVPKGEKRSLEWNKVRDDFGEIDKWIGGRNFVGGDSLSYSDMEIAGYVLWVRTIFGESSEEWKMFSGWHEGRWRRLLDALKPYEVVDV